MDSKKERQRAQYQQRKEQGLCGLCGRSRENPNKAICSSCKEKQQSKYANRRSQGCCFVCDQPAIKKGSSYCQYHYDLRMGRRDERREAGVCYMCGKERAISTGKRCKKCWFKNIAQSLNGPTPEQLESKFEEQNHKCSLSGRKLVPGENTHIDHIVARAKGGLDDLENLRWVDKQVNQAKGAMGDEELLQLVRDIYENFGRRIP